MLHYGLGKHMRTIRCLYPYRLKAALGTKPAGEEVAQNLLKVPAAQRILSWLLDPQLTPVSEQSAEYHSHIATTLAAIDEAVTEARAARVADLLDHIAGLPNYQPVMISLYSVFGADRAARLGQHLAAAAPEGSRARVAELAAALWPVTRAAKAADAFEPMLTDPRLEEWLAAADSVLTEARLKRLAEWLSKAEPSFKVEQTKTMSQAIAPEATVARAQAIGQLLEEFATRDRVAGMMDSLAIQITAGRLQRYASLVDYAATNDRLQRLLPLVSIIPKLVTPARTKQVSSLIDTIGDR